MIKLQYHQPCNDLVCWKFLEIAQFLQFFLKINILKSRDVHYSIAMASIISHHSMSSGREPNRNKNEQHFTLKELRAMV